MTLHEAIIKVLLDANMPLSSEGIANGINEQKLYTRRDGQKLSASQVSARAGNYPELLKINGDSTIEIVNRTLHSFRITYYHILNRFRKSRLSSFDIRFIAACTIYVSWLNPEKQLLKNIPDKIDFIQFFHELTQSLQPRESMRKYMSLLEQLTAFELHEISQFVYSPPSAGKIDTFTFGSFFNDVINEYNSDEDLKSGESSTPSVISKFISSFYSVNKGGKIFDPFVGYGGTIVQAFRYNVDQNPRVVAGDINVPALQMAEMNALANGCGREYFYHKNAFTDWNNSIKADLIVTVPPIGVKVPMYGLHNAFKEQNEVLYATGLAFAGNEMRSDLAAIAVAIAHLNSKGRAVIMVPNNILFSNATVNSNLRELLVSNNILDGVVALPEGAFRPVHSASCSVLLINLDRKGQRNIFFCDASKLLLDTFAIEYSKIADAFKKRGNYNASAKWLDIDEIKTKDFSLDAKRHVTKLVIDESFLTIADIATVSSGTGIPKTNINRQKGIPFIQVGDLEDSPGLNEIDLSKAAYFISDEGLLPKKPNYIPDNAVLITKIGVKLKATLYKYHGNALCNPNVIIIKTVENKVLAEYLITQLQSDYVIRQIDALRHGTGVIHFSQVDFVNIKIKVPSIEEQRAFVTSFYGKKLKESEIATEQKQEEDFYNMVANIKHELKQPVSSLGMYVNALSDFLHRKAENGGTIKLDELTEDLLPGETIEDAKNTTLEAVLNRMFFAVNDASKTLMKAEEILNIGRGAYHAEKFYLRDFLNTVVKPVFSGENCVMNILGEDYEITADKYQLEVLFKRLIENAIKHGFRNGTDKLSNIINIKLTGKTPNKDFNEIIVENNGSPLPEGFDVNKFQKSGHTTNRKSGTGFGGFHVKRIIDSHKGEISIADKKEIGESQFKVKFKIYLP